MKEINLKSALSISNVKVQVPSDTDFGIDICYKNYPDASNLWGNYTRESVERFVQELAEALDMSFYRPVPIVDPIVLPEAAYEEVVKLKQTVEEQVGTNAKKCKADYLLWETCRKDLGESPLATWLFETNGGVIDLAKILMGEVPFECGKVPSYVLKSKYGYLKNVSIHPNENVSIDVTNDYDKSLKFASRTEATDFLKAIPKLSDYRVEVI